MKAPIDGTKNTKVPQNYYYEQERGSEKKNLLKRRDEKETWNVFINQVTT